VVENIRRLLSGLNSQQPLVIGRLMEMRSILWTLFPMSQRESFDMESAILLSRTSIRLIATSPEHCAPGRWFSFSFQYSGKGLLYCTNSKGIHVWDPVDEEGKHLIVSTNVRELFSKVSSTSTDHKVAISSKSDGNGDKPSSYIQLAGCCSHRAISFACMNYREQRVLHFMVSRLKVFGLDR